MPEIKEASFELDLGLVKLGAKLSEDDRLQPELDLTASAAGYATKHYSAVPNANELVIPLTRAQ